MKADGLVASAGAALEKGRWVEARDLFQVALARQESPEALAGMGEALWWLGETGAGVEFRQRAYSGYRKQGDGINAALQALALSVTYVANFGNLAAATGWLARAERLLGEDPGPLQGWLWLLQGYLAEGPELSRELLELALNFARQSDDRDLELVGLADLGLKLVEGGEAEKGLALIDEAMAATLGGENNRFDTVVYACCDMLAACDLVGDLERATQWCRVADDFIRDFGCPFLYSHCRTLYGSVLLAKGLWKQAESELVAASRMAGSGGPAMHDKALVRLAHLRLLQGRLEEAETLLAASEDTLITDLTSASLRLARGEPGVAAAILNRHLRTIGDDGIESAPALALLVDALIATGELQRAEDATRRLEESARRQVRTHSAALAALARARVSMAKGESSGPILEELEQAFEGFSQLEMRLEMGITKMEIAALVASGQPELAVTEASAALRLFEAVGAIGSADRAASMLRSMGAAGRRRPRNQGVLTRREQEVLELVGLGLSNPEIAERLVISRRTAGHHVSSLLAKLGLRNRAEAVAYAARMHLP